MVRSANVRCAVSGYFVVLHFLVVILVIRQSFFCWLGALFVGYRTFFVEPREGVSIPARKICYADWGRGPWVSINSKGIIWIQEWKSNFICCQAQEKRSHIKILISKMSSSSKLSDSEHFCNTTGMPSIERVWGKGNPDYDGTLSIIVVGASGNLAMLKVGVVGPD